MNINHVKGDAFFTAIQRVPKQYPYLTEDLKTEILILGGGVTGSIVAYYLSKLGVDTVVIEKERIGHGSTSITTALLQYELDDNLRELEQYTSLEKGVESYKLGVKALDELEAFIKAYGNCCDYKKRDTLVYTSKKEEVGVLKEEYQLRKNNGLNVKWLDHTNNPFSFDLKGGVYSIEGGAEINPYLYTHQLLEVAGHQGAKVYENTEAKVIHYGDEDVEIITQYGYKIKAKKIILATGYATEWITQRQFGKKTTTFNIVTEPVKDFNGWPNQVLIRDNATIYHYLRTTPDQRIIMGGEDSDYTPGIEDDNRAEQKYQLLENHLNTMFPKIRPIEIAYKYCGTFISTQDNLGFIGEDPKHKTLWYCLGYGANGILFAILGGLMLSKLYLGEKDENLRLFAVDRFDGKRK